MRHSLAACLIALTTLTSCLQIGINLRHKTPRRASVLPKFTARDSLLGHNNRHREAYDARHYRIDLTFDVENRTIAGVVTTRLIRKTPEPVIQLDLEQALTVDSVMADGKRLKFSRRHTALFVELASAQREQAVAVYYHGRPRTAKRPPWEGGFVWKKDDDRKTFAGVACEGEGAAVWLPVKTCLGDETDSITCLFTVPAGLTAVSNGKLFGIKENNGRKTYHWQTSYPVNPYNITFYIARYAHFSETYAGNDGQSFGLDYYVLKQHEEAAREHFKQVPDILRCFERAFGAYPWPRDGYRLVESPYAGMEHQTAIAYGQRYRNDLPGPTDYIILHESAHEWWGNAVSVADFADVWIHEGFATYAEALFMEATGGRSMYLSYMNYLALRVVNRKPVIGPPGVYYWNYKDPDVYVKGAVMLHTLRNQLNNDSLFFGIIRKFYEQNRGGITNTAAFESLVAGLGGNEVLQVVKQYLYRRESPLLEWWPVEKEGQRGIGYRLKRTDPEFRLRLRCRYGSHTFDILAEKENKEVLFPIGPDAVPELNLDRSYLQVKKRRKP